MRSTKNLLLELLETRLLLRHVAVLQAETEPNDTPETADVLGLDTISHDPADGLHAHVQGNLNLCCYLPAAIPAHVANTPQDEDWFSFRAGPNTTIRVAVRDALPSGLAMSLVNANGELARDTHSTDGLSVELDVGPDLDVAREGTFLVRLSVTEPVRIFQELEPQCTDVIGESQTCSVSFPYWPEVHVSAARPVEQEPNDTIERANQIVLHQEDAAIQGAIVARLSSDLGPPGYTGPARLDVDWFSFEVSAGQSVHVGTNGLGGGQMAILDERGVALARDTSPADGLWLDWTSRDVQRLFVRFSFPDDVVPSQLGACFEGYSTYIVRASAKPAPGPEVKNLEQEPTDTFESANTIELAEVPRSNCDTECAPPDRPAEPVLRGFVRGQLAARGRFWGPSICFDSYVGEELSFTCTTDEVEHVALGADFFAFDVPAGSDINVELTGPLAETRGLIFLFDEQLRQLVTDLDPPDGVSLDWSAPAGGKFFVEVTGISFGSQCEMIAVLDWASATQQLHSICGAPPLSSIYDETLTSYTLHVTATVKPSPNPSDGPDEHEPNDTREQANPIVLEETLDRLHGVIEGTVDDRLVSRFCPACSPDSDYFSFSANPNSRIEVRLTGEAADVTVAPMLLDGSKQPNEVGSALAKGWGRDTDGDGARDSVVLDFFTQTGGRFFVQLAVRGAGFGGRSYDYRLDLTVTPDANLEVEPNDDFDHANSIPLSLQEPACRICGPEIVRIPEDAYRRGFVTGELVGESQDQTDQDFFRIEVPEPAEVTIQLNTVIGQERRLTLFDADHREIETDDEPTDGFAALYWTADAAREFFIRVDDSLLADAPDRRQILCQDYSDRPGVCLTDEQYTLDVYVRPTVADDPHHEQEPNDRLDRATAIVLEPATASGDGQLHGFINGILDNRFLLVIDCEICPRSERDFFSFAAGAEQLISVSLRVEPAADGARFALLDWSGAVLATSATRGNGDAGRGLIKLKYLSHEPNVFFVRLDEGATGAIVTRYRVDVSIGPETHFEREPNDSTEQAGVIELATLPTFAPGVVLRGGDVRGFAGGRDDDRDFFQFDVQAGEHVNVVLDEVFGGGLVCRPTPGQGCQQLPPPRLLQLVVFDSAGNEAGRSNGSDAGRPHIALDAAADETYFAIVSASEPGDTLARYRLGIVASMHLDQSAAQPEGKTNNGPPLEITLRAGQSLEFTDSDGEHVRIDFKGRAGSAIVTFTDATADGSDIQSVVINGVRRPGKLVIRSDGTAEVGSVAIHGGALRSRRRPVLFGRVKIDGNLGSFSSDVDVRTLAVDGILGAVTASGHTIGQVSAIVFDRATADVAGIRKLTVQEEMADALFDHFLPWDEPDA